MAIGKRIKFFRLRKKLTQKQLGEVLGFIGKTSEVRIAQYESESRIPKQDLINEMASYLDVSDKALTVPEIDTQIGLMHTLFAIEDMYGLKVEEIDNRICLCFDPSVSKDSSSIFSKVLTWHGKAEQLTKGEITKEEYDDWRYTYPKQESYEIPINLSPEALEVFYPQIVEREKQKELRKKKLEEVKKKK